MRKVWLTSLVVSFFVSIQAHGTGGSMSAEEFRNLQRQTAGTRLSVDAILSPNLTQQLDAAVAAANVSMPGENPHVATRANLASIISDIQRYATYSSNPNLPGGALSFQVNSVSNAVNAVNTGVTLPIKDLATEIIAMRNAVVGSSSNTVINPAAPPFHDGTAPNSDPQTLILGVIAKFEQRRQGTAAFNDLGTPITSLLQIINSIN